MPDVVHDASNIHSDAACTVCVCDVDAKLANALVKFLIDPGAQRDIGDYRREAYRFSQQIRGQGCGSCADKEE